MAGSFLEKYRLNLEAELNNQKFKQAFEKVKSAYPIFQKYFTTDDLKGLIQIGNKNYAHKDEIMVILLKEVHKNNAIYPLINIMFWDSLHGIYSQKRFRVSDQEELFDRIQIEFYYSLMNHNLERLPKKININILFNTRKKIIAWEKENIFHNETLGQVEYLCEDGMSPVNLWKSKFHLEEMKDYLLNMFDRKIITELQYDLILETQVYKIMSQKEWAIKRDIPHNTVRTLMLRAKKAMKSFEEERKREKN